MLTHRTSWLLLLLAWSLSSPATDRPAPQVTVDKQTLQGEWVETPVSVAAFRGIPFAAPPVGELRWRKPRPPAPAAGLREAVQFGAACQQDRAIIDWYGRVADAFGHGPDVVEGPVGMSEDCLYLNVWTPLPKAGAGLPVIVFVHGGSNAGGWSYERNYRGSRLAAGGAVVVTVAYRVGVFGFFAHPALEPESGVPAANFALHDLVAAFRWVQDHIVRFGGDPARITAIGESSGALNLVDLLAASLDGRVAEPPLFRRLVLQSLGGSLVERQTLAAEQATGAALISSLGLAGAIDAARLRSLPAEDLLAATASLPGEHYHDAVIDGYFLDAAPAAMLAGAGLSGVEIIAGTNADEWLMYLPEKTGEPDLDAWIASHAPESAGALQELVGAQPDPRRRLDRLRTAREMLCPSLWLAGLASRSGGSGRVYQFRRVRTGAGGEVLGAYHGAELPYVFGTHDDWLPTGQADRQLTAAIQGYWLGFARLGDPGSVDGVAWPRYRANEPEALVLDEIVTVARPADIALCDILWQTPVAESARVR